MSFCEKAVRFTSNQNIVHVKKARQLITNQRDQTKVIFDVTLPSQGLGSIRGTFKKMSFDILFIHSFNKPPPVPWCLLRAKSTNLCALILSKPPSPSC